MLRWADSTGDGAGASELAQNPRGPSAGFVALCLFGLDATWPGERVASPICHGIGVKCVGDIFNYFGHLFQEPGPNLGLCLCFLTSFFGWFLGFFL